MKNVYYDCLMSFGKFSGVPVADLCHSQPSYLYWLMEGEIASLDTKCLDIVNKWAKDNPKTAERSRASAKSVAAKGRKPNGWEAVKQHAEELAHVSLVTSDEDIFTPIENEEVTLASTSRWGSW